MKEENHFEPEMASFIESVEKSDSVEEIAMLATTFLYQIIPTHKIAVSIVERNILRSLNVIGPRVFHDLPLDQRSVNTRAINTGKTQLVNDTRVDPDYFPGNGVYAYDMQSELCVPIVYGGKVLGTINLENSRCSYFSKGDALIVEATAEKIAPAMYNILYGDQIVEPFGSRRSRLEVKGEMLRVIAQGETLKTKICNAVNVSWELGSKLLEELEFAGHIGVETKTGLTKNCHITELGSRILTEYNKIENLLKNEVKGL